MLKALKIWWLKRRLKSAARSAIRWKDYMDCGYRLAIHIDPTILEYEAEADSILDQLAELDPTTPTFRFRGCD